MKTKKRKKVFCKVYCFFISIIIGQSLFYLVGGAQEQNNSVEVQSEQENTVEDYYNSIDFDEIQTVLDEIFQDTESFDFAKTVKDYITGEKAFSINEIANELKDRFVLEISENRKLFSYLLLIGIVAAIFSNFANVFQNAQAAEIGFYITYLLLASILITSFLSAFQVAEKMLSVLMDFMKALIPTYCITMTFASGVTTSSTFYQSTLVIIGIIEFFLIKIVLPAIQVYFLLVLTTHFTKEDFLSRFADLIYNIIIWLLKTVFGIVIGFQTIQGLLVPAVNQLKNTVFSKTISVIPGVGSTVTAVLETMIGSGILVKNTVGVVGMIVIVIICAIPILRILIYFLVYRLGGALLQPVAEKRILDSMQGASKAAGLLLYTGLIGGGLFLLTIVVLTSVTNK